MVVPVFILVTSSAHGTQPEKSDKRWGMRAGGGANLVSVWDSANGPHLASTERDRQRDKQADRHVCGSGNQHTEYR